MSMKKLISTGFAIMLGLGMTGVASAQAQGGQQQAPAAPQQQLPDMDFSDSELQSFIDVQSDLQVIRQEYSGRLEETDDPETAASLQEEASQEMVEVLQSSDLDVEKYNQIALALQQDEELLQRVQGMLDQG